ncbi:hypothetical protein [Nocardioides sp. URHA0032]|uniref:hypothetical protein n=1 Tax=Nocardioides sp. URHA0032 TaxID=1380388 RepID=UPI0012DD4A30|nr:hypothetical protein [Nocardioides sp. URHA0032]
MAPLARIALAGLLGALIAGCGGGADESSRSTDPAPDAGTDAATAAASPDLERFLLQEDEGPSLEPVVSPQTDSEEPFDLSQGGAERLQRSGYIANTYQPGRGASSAGVSSVLLFETETEAGARGWMAYETSDEALNAQIPGERYKRFEVPEVPGANGWTGPDIHGNAIGQVYWTQGRCMMTISLETMGPRVEPLSAGAKAIYERTGGTCPESRS